MPRETRRKARALKEYHTQDVGDQECRLRQSSLLVRPLKPWRRCRLRRLNTWSRGLSKAKMFRVHLDLRKRRRLRCSRSGALGRVGDRLKTLKWKHVPLWGIPVTLVYAPARVTCPDCRKVRVETIPWSQGKCRLSVGLIWLLSAWRRLLAWDVVVRRTANRGNEQQGKGSEPSLLRIPNRQQLHHRPIPLPRQPT